MYSWLVYSWPRYNPHRERERERERVCVFSGERGRKRDLVQNIWQSTRGLSSNLIFAEPEVYIVLTYCIAFAFAICNERERERTKA